MAARKKATEVSENKLGTQTQSAFFQGMQEATRSYEARSVRSQLDSVWERLGNPDVYSLQRNTDGTVSVQATWKG